MPSETIRRALRGLRAERIRLRPRYTVSIKAVLPSARAARKLFRSVPASSVKLKRLSGRDATAIRKLSSSGLAVFRKARTAAVAAGSLSRMLPLRSRITPTEHGASSRLKVRIGCGAVSSRIVNLSWVSPLTETPLRSATMADTRTMRTCARAEPAPAAGETGEPKPEAQPRLLDKDGQPREGMPQVECGCDYVKK